MIKEGWTVQLQPSILLGWCLEPFLLGVWVTGDLAWWLHTFFQLCLPTVSELSVKNPPVLSRFGRKRTLLVSYVSGMLFAIASAFSTTYMMFVALRFLTGYCTSGIDTITIVLSNHPDYIMFKLLMCSMRWEVWFFFRCGVGGHTYLHVAMAKAKSEVTLIISCRQSVTQYTMAASSPFHTVQGL